MTNSNSDNATLCLFSGEDEKLQKADRAIQKMEKSYRESFYQMADMAHDVGLDWWITSADANATERIQISVGRYRNQHKRANTNFAVLQVCEDFKSFKIHLNSDFGKYKKNEPKEFVPLNKEFMEHFMECFSIKNKSVTVDQFNRFSKIFFIDDFEKKGRWPNDCPTILRGGKTGISKR